MFRRSLQFLAIVITAGLLTAGCATAQRSKLGSSSGQQQIEKQSWPDQARIWTGNYSDNSPE